MSLEVRLFAYLRENRGKIVYVDAEPGKTTVMDVLEMLDIPEEEASLILINGRDAELTSVFKEEDYLVLFPPVGGG